MSDLHPAEHRGLRELYVMARRQRDHWRRLAARLDASAPDEAQLLREGAGVARALIGELEEMTAKRGIHGRPAAQGLGARIAALQSVLLDPSLEVGQALRFAAHDVEHVVVLLQYLAALARRRDDEELATLLSDWVPRMREHEEGIRAACVALADDPDRAIRAASPGKAGTLVHGAAAVVGTVGEWVDGRASR